MCCSLQSDSVEGMEDDSKQQELDKGVGEEGEEENDTVDTLGVTTVLAVSNLRVRLSESMCTPHAVVVTTLHEIR